MKWKYFINELVFYGIRKGNNVLLDFNNSCNFRRIKLEILDLFFEKLIKYIKFFEYFSNLK